MNINKAGVRPKTDADPDRTADGLKGDVAKLDGDFSPQPYEQDTPGRPKTAGSRQQTQPDQKSATGSSELDSKSRK